MSLSTDFLHEAELIAGQLQVWRRDFHRHPELAFEERRSSGIIAELLESWDYRVQDGIAETGLSALLEGSGQAPGVLLRVDMDALPIQEKNDTEYASVHDGVMHACGHDGHMAIGLGVARIMRRFADQLQGDLCVLFQPAEEGQGGAARMIAEDVLKGKNLRTSLGIHLWNEKPIGWFGITAGSIMAGAEKFELRVRGQGGHGGMPNLTNDPVIAAASIITNIQTIIARKIDPLDSAVLSVTHVEGGSNFNVIPDEVLLEGTIRTLHEKTRFEIIDLFESAAKDIAHAHSCEVELSIEQVAPPVINDPVRAQFIADVARGLFTDGHVDTEYRVMVSEDFALFLKEIPGVFTFIGSANEALGLNAGHHTPYFDFDEAALTHAVALLCTAIWEELKLDD